VVCQRWQRPLGIAVAEVVVLFVLTFAQPPLFVRLGLDVTLAVGVWSVARRVALGARGSLRGSLATPTTGSK